MNKILRKSNILWTTWKQTYLTLLRHQYKWYPCYATFTQHLVLFPKNHFIIYFKLYQTFTHISINTQNIPSLQCLTFWRNCISYPNTTILWIIKTIISPILNRSIRFINNPYWQIFIYSLNFYAKIKNPFHRTSSSHIWKYIGCFYSILIIF